MRRRLAVLGVAFAVVGGTVALSMVPAAQTEAAAGRGPTFVIPANDGYGIAECIRSGSACGKVVADAWCEAQGFARSASFGFADVDATGSIGAGRPFSVTCAH